jgi:hypothetical protein
MIGCPLKEGRNALCNALVYEVCYYLQQELCWGRCEKAQKGSSIPFRPGSDIYIIEPVVKASYAKSASRHDKQKPWM